MLSKYKPRCATKDLSSTDMIPVHQQSYDAPSATAKFKVFCEESQTNTMPVKGNGSYFFHSAPILKTSVSLNNT